MDSRKLREPKENFCNPSQAVSFKTFGKSILLRAVLIIGVVLLIAPAMRYGPRLGALNQGIGGSIVGGLIARLFSKPEPGSKFHPAGFTLSIIGAIILLFIWGKFAT